LDQARRESIYRGYRLINTVGVALLATVALLLAFSVSYVASAREWPDLPLGATWADLGVFALAAAVPPGARWGADKIVEKAARRGRGRHLAAAVQIVGWAAVGLWTSCQVPVLVGFGLAFLRERMLYLLPFYAVATACAFLVVPRFKTWEHWFHLLQNPGKRTRIRSA
jgi:hypothetical protein